MSTAAKQRNVPRHKGSFDVRGTVHDFDFLAGRWKVHCRRLLKPLSRSNEWIDFDGTNVSRPVWHGHGNFDEFEAETPSGRIQGLTVRLFDPRLRRWAIYWANASRALIDIPPMSGGFEKGRGEFYNREQFDGRPIVVRFLWTVNSADSCRWEQAFSGDDGETWETNWTWDLIRVKP
jgi:hypothetical protein